MDEERLGEGETVIKEWLMLSHTSFSNSLRDPLHSLLVRQSLVPYGWESKAPLGRTFYGNIVWIDGLSQSELYLLSGWERGEISWIYVSISYWGVCQCCPCVLHVCACNKSGEIRFKTFELFILKTCQSLLILVLLSALITVLWTLKSHSTKNVFYLLLLLLDVWPSHVSWVWW